MKRIIPVVLLLSSVAGLWFVLRDGATARIGAGDHALPGAALGGDHPREGMNVSRSADVERIAVGVPAAERAGFEEVHRWQENDVEFDDRRGRLTGKTLVEKISRLIPVRFVSVQHMETVFRSEIAPEVPPVLPVGEVMRLMEQQGMQFERRGGKLWIHPGGKTE